MASNTDTPKTHSNLGRVFTSFESPNFRYIWVHFLFNFVAMDMLMLAQGWLVWESTHSVFLVGAVAGLRGVGQFSFGALGGVLADRYNRRIILTVCQVVRASSCLWLGLLIVSNYVEVWHMLVFSGIQGVVMGALLPASETLVYDIVGPKRIINAAAIKHGAYSISRIPSALLFGAIVSSIGTGPCFLFIALVTLLSPIPLFWMVIQYSRPARTDGILKTLKFGLSYAGNNSSIRSLLMLSVVVELFGFSYFIMLPVMADLVLHSGAWGLTMLSLAGSVGGIVATVVFASITSIRKEKSIQVGYSWLSFNRTTLLALTSVATGLSIIIFSVSSWMEVSLIMAAFVGGSLVSYDTSMGTLIQIISSDAVRGRMMGLYGLTFGFTPVGGFLSGILATYTNPQFALGLGGVFIVVFTAAILIPTRSLWNSQE